MKRYIITITGKVQNVYFRDTARRVADDLGLTGFARNEPDGSVYIEVEGDESALREFRAWCNEGSELSKVEHVSYAESTPLGDSDFTIR